MRLITSILPIDGADDDQGWTLSPGKVGVDGDTASPDCCAWA
jgi:hypothetical protein